VSGDSALHAGGKLLLAGRLPDKDMVGEPCTDLRDALGLKPLQTLRELSAFYLSVTPHGWAAPRPETRVGFAQLYEAADGDTVLRELTTGHGCGFDLPVGAGHAVVISTDYECDLAFWRAAFAALGVAPGLRHTSSVPGLILLTTADADGNRILHALNVSGYDQQFSITEQGTSRLNGETVYLPGRRALMLPVGLDVGELRIAYATAEVASVSSGSITFSTAGHQAVVAIDGGAVCDHPSATIERQKGQTIIRVDHCEEFIIRVA
jgi:beta-galactosidase